MARTKSDDTFLGLVSLDQHQGGNETEVSYEFLPEHWGSGYASETVQAVISFAFKTLDLPQIVAEKQTANAPSRKLLERLGMTLSSSTHRFGEPQSIYTLARP